MKHLILILAALVAFSPLQAIPTNDRDTIRADLAMRAESAVLWREWYSRDDVESAYYLGRVEGLQLANKLVAQSPTDESYATLVARLDVYADSEQFVGSNLDDKAEAARALGRSHGLAMAAALIAIYHP